MLKEKKNAFLFLFSALILLFLFSKTDVHKIFLIFGSIDKNLLCLAIVISISINIFGGSYKWKKILEAMNQIAPFSVILQAKLISYPLKLLTPFKAGEIFKAGYLSWMRKFNFSKTLGSVIFDKFLNLLGTLSLLSGGVFFFEPKFYLKMVSLFGIALLLYLFLYIPYNLHTKMKFPSWINNLFLGFKEINPKRKAILLFYSIFYQLSELINAYILGKAINLDIPWGAIFLYVPLIVLIANIPITVSGLGTREACIILFFFRYGTKEALFSLGLLLSLVEYVLPAFIGLVCFTMIKFHRNGEN